MAEYSGDAGDAMAAAALPNFTSNGQKFSTPDSDNDTHDTTSCALNKACGWWFGHCSASSLYRATVRIWSTTSPAAKDVQASRMLVKLN